MAKKDNKMLIMGIAIIALVAFILGGATFSVTSVDSSPYGPGDIFSYTFQLTQTSDETLPSEEWYLYYAYTVRDQGNNIMAQPEPVEITADTASGTIVNVPVSYTVPSDATSGKYIAGTVLMKKGMVFDPTTSEWLETETIVLDKAARQFTVAGPRPAPSINFVQKLFDLLSSIWGKLYGLFG